MQPLELAGASTVDGRTPHEAPPTPSFLPAPAYLLVFEGDSTRRVPLPQGGEVTVGRSELSVLRLADPKASRTHAVFEVHDGAVALRDLGSQNGTLVNEEPLVGRRALASGDVVSIGDATLLLHAPAARGPASGLLELSAFRARAALEFERAVRFGRPAALVTVVAPPAIDRQRAALTVTGLLRAHDFAAWTATGHLTTLCPEAADDEARELATALIDALAPASPGALRAGVARCPDDGADLETLLAAARAAAQATSHGAVGEAASTFLTRTIGGVRVLVADAAMVRLYELVDRLARSELTVLVQGETGAGKELVATALHEASARAGGRLLAVNCAALQESLLESELFGHERGAFTGATAAKAGLLESASGGTVFLDEVGEMSGALQAKLLRALETRRITRVGDTRERAVDLRIVAATHRDLLGEVRSGRFREDLYYRLAGATLWIPPLRDRTRELPLLARCLLDDASRRLGRDAPVLAPETLRRLASHPWPGNVRELKSVMEYLAATVSDGIIEPWHLDARVPPATPAAGPVLGVPGPPRGPRAAPGGPSAFRPIADELRDLERRRMLEALEATAWTQTRAAALIAMPLRTFVTKFRHYGLATRSR